MLWITLMQRRCPHPLYQPNDVGAIWALILAKEEIVYSVNSNKAGVCLHEYKKYQVHVEVQQVKIRLSTTVEEEE